MANILIKTLDKGTDTGGNMRQIGQNASIMVDGALKYIGENGQAGRSGIGFLERANYRIRDLNGQILVNITGSGLFSPTIQFQMGPKSLAVMKKDGFLRKNPVLHLRGHEYYLPKPNPQNGHFKIENWSFQFNENQEMLISKPNDGRNIAALAIGYYFWARKKGLSPQKLH